MTFKGASLIAAFAASNLAACATFDLSTQPKPLPVERAASSCSEWVAAVDGVVTSAGVNDAGAYHVPGFPYLRVDRFTASFAQQALNDSGLFEAWAREGRALDREGRSIELQNLPATNLAEIGAATTEVAAARTESCANELMASDFRDPAVRARAVANARVPDDYIDVNRVIGLYPIAYPVFAAGVARWHAEAVDAFREYAANRQARGPVVRYAPPAGKMLSQNEVAALIERAPRDRLGKILPEAEQLERLFESFAPVFEVENGSDSDAIGALAWRSQTHPFVERSRPVVYVRLAYTRYGGEVLPQLVYTAWFPERPSVSAFDILAGMLDGVVFRVTLARDGAPLVYDSVHPCGCYHMFFPTGRVRETASPRPGDEWSFVPAAAPALQAGQRIVLHVQSRTHYLTGFGMDAGDGTFTYGFQDDNVLRSLPLPGGGRRSVYAADGLIAGTERPERMLFWPMGVPSAGTMRQWGHHATAFLGRRHLDDPDLIERRFAPAP